MSDESQLAVAEPPARKKQDRKPAQSKPKTMPPYGVIVLNDDLHTFDYVVETFQKVFGYPLEKALQLVALIHATGRGLVWSGSKEVAELKCDQIRGAGPDLYAMTKVEFPLGAYIEPLPG
jgi:ATP-dependent Clp protease adaptor protein ClpS